MKNKFLVVLSMMMVFGLFATVFALNNKPGSETAKTESCPMQNQKVQKADDAADMSKVVVVKSDGGDDCCQPGADCCKGGSCCHKKK